MADNRHRFLILLQILSIVNSMDQLHIAYQWKQMDFEFSSEEVRQEFIDSQVFIPENNIPMGLEVYEKRLFVTVPRWANGVPSTLNYIDLTDNSTMSPKLYPYPNWAAHQGSPRSQPDIVSPFRVRADKFGRLWVIDSGKSGILESNGTSVPPAIIIYDLHTDRVLRRFTIPADQVKEDSFFGNIAVEDLSYDDSYAYIADILKPALLVYSWKTDESWRVNHNYFHPDPLACDFNVRGLNFSWTDGIFGLALSKPRADNYSTLYFNPLASYDEFSVSTEFLRSKAIADVSYKEFKILGSRGPNAQSSVAFIDQKTGILFYSLVNLNAVACWKTDNKEYSLKSQGRIYMNNVSMVFPSDIKVDYDDNLWILSNRMPVFMYKSLDQDDVNFRIFSAPVVDAISHTACDITPRSDILDKFMNKGKPQLKSSGSQLHHTSAISLILIGLLATSMFLA